MQVIILNEQEKTAFTASNFQVKRKVQKLVHNSTYLLPSNLQSTSLALLPFCFELFTLPGFLNNSVFYIVTNSGTIRLISILGHKISNFIGELQKYIRLIRKGQRYKLCLNLWLYVHAAFFEKQMWRLIKPKHSFELKYFNFQTLIILLFFSFSCCQKH